jgi:hypothetical protein
MKPFHEVVFFEDTIYNVCHVDSRVSIVEGLKGKEFVLEFEILVNPVTSNT